MRQPSVNIMTVERKRKDEYIHKVLCSRGLRVLYGNAMTARQSSDNLAAREIAQSTSKSDTIATPQTKKVIVDV